MWCSIIKKCWGRKFENCRSNPFPIREHCGKAYSAFRGSSIFLASVFGTCLERRVGCMFGPVLCLSLLITQHVNLLKALLVCLFPHSSVLCRQNLNFQLIVLYSAKMNWSYRMSAYISVVLFQSRTIDSIPGCFRSSSVDLSRFFFHFILLF